MRSLILIFTLLGLPASAQPELPLPRLYTVTGVASNDTLNVREAPNASALDIGDLMPGEVAEVLGLAENGTWGKVTFSEGVGWVSMRYMRFMPEAYGDWPVLPYGIPKHLACSGAEPFWGAEITAGNSVVLQDYSFADTTPQTFMITGMSRPVNMGPSRYGFTSPPLSGVIRREYCDDGMSEMEYGWSLDLIGTSRNGETFMYSGCCTAVAP